jgi:DNA-binding transcriptional MerR regulator
MPKGPEAFRTISEAAEALGAPQHVLRFWETKFSFIRPMKRAGGRRFYRPQDIAMLRGIQALLHRDGYTIRGVSLLYREHGIQRILAAPNGPAEVSAPAAASAAPAAEPGLSKHLQPSLRRTLQALTEAKARLDKVVDRS